jgi:hypothetical protein
MGEILALFCMSSQVTSINHSSNRSGLYTASHFSTIAKRTKRANTLDSFKNSFAFIYTTIQVIKRD